MKIVFYNTTSFRFNPDSAVPYYYPTRADMFEEALSPYTDENEFILVSRRPASYLVDMDKEGISQKAEDLEYVLLDEYDDSEKIFQVIIDQNRVWLLQFLLLIFQQKK